MIKRNPVSGSVLLVSNLFSVGATYGGVCKELAVRLSNDGWQVIITSPAHNRLLRSVDMVWTVWRARRDYAIAQIDVFSGPAFVWAEAVTWLLRRLGKPYVLTLRGGSLPTFAKRWPGRVRRVLDHAAYVTTPSRYLHEQMAQYRNDLRLLPNPIDLERYRCRLREQPKPRLVWLRAFHRMYNPSLAARVLGELVGDYPETNLIMVGPDKGDGSFQSCQHAVQELGLEHKVQFPGGVPKSDVPDWLNKGDIFLNTTNVDNTPVSVIEAMAMGMCVVSTNVGGIPYLLEHEHDALLVPPDAPQAMADAVRRILTEPGLAERLSRNARAKAEQFDWSVILPQWEILLDNTMLTSKVRDIKR